MNENIANPNDNSNKQIAIWLFICCILVLCMVALGGYTRLTNSGLSMTTWKPVVGIIPPIGQEQWQAEMEKYRTSPEYQKINKGFSLDEFKRIFMVEYLHRVLGRIIGLCFLLPFLWFLFRRKISKKLSAKLVGVFILGGMQGVVGWYMVKSGLVDDPHVSQYRLSFHLIFAMLIYALMLWIALGLWFGNKIENISALYKICVGFIALIVIQSMLGGFVAGLKAGLIYNTFPLMGDGLVPEDMWLLEPWYRNLGENPSAVQFIHRFVAIFLFCYGLVFWLKGRIVCSKSFNILLAALLTQLGLGIATLIFEVPVLLGVLHQVTAFILLTVTLFIFRKLCLQTHIDG